MILALLTVAIHWARAKQWHRERTKKKKTKLIRNSSLFFSSFFFHYSFAVSFIFFEARRFILYAVYSLFVSQQRHFVQCTTDEMCNLSHFTIFFCDSVCLFSLHEKQVKQNYSLYHLIAYILIANCLIFCVICILVEFVFVFRWINEWFKFDKESST